MLTTAAPVLEVSVPLVTLVSALPAILVLALPATLALALPATLEVSALLVPTLAPPAAAM